MTTKEQYQKQLEMNAPWIWTFKEHMHPIQRREKETGYEGKWLMFIPLGDIVETWNVVCEAMHNKLLGDAAKIRTLKEFAEELDARKGHRVVCIYTYNSKDTEDILRVLAALRSVGMQYEAWYKEDVATKRGAYSSPGHGVTLYHARYGRIELLESRK